jgi:hypothetical protein
MAKRPNLSAADLKDTSTQRPAPAEPARNSKAQTLRLPPEYWRRLRTAAAIQDMSQIAIVQKAHRAQPAAGRSVTRSSYDG